MNSKLNSILAASVATAVAAGGILATTAQANAAAFDASNFTGAHSVNLVKTSAGYLEQGINSAVQQSSGVDISVRRPLEMPESERAKLKEMRADEPQRVAALQSSIRNNNALLVALTKRNVDVRNVVDARQAADGGLIFYEM